MNFFNTTTKFVPSRIVIMSCVASIIIDTTFTQQARVCVCVCVKALRLCRSNLKPQSSWKCQSPPKKVINLKEKLQFLLVYSITIHLTWTKKFGDMMLCYIITLWNIGQSIHQALHQLLPWLFLEISHSTYALWSLTSANRRTHCKKRFRNSCCSH